MSATAVAILALIFFYSA